MKVRARIQKIRSREGSALLIALLALAGLSILGLSLMLVTDTEMQISNDERLRKQALYAAEAGIEHALVFMRGIDTQFYGYNGGNAGLLTGDPSYDPPTQPPDDLNSYNESIVKAENLYDPASPWRRPTLARKGNVLKFDQIWFKPGFTAPADGYALRDIPFEQSVGTGAFDVGAFKSRYTVYVKNNLDDDTLLPDTPTNPNPLSNEPAQYEYDLDKKVVLTAEGIVDVGQKGSPDGVGYKVVRTVEVTIQTGSNIVCDDYASAGGAGGTGNRTLCDEIPVITPQPQNGSGSAGMVKRNSDWS